MPGNVVHFPPNSPGPHDPAVPDFPDPDEALRQLKALGIPFDKISDYHLKRGSINYYVRSGKMIFDGQRRSADEPVGFQNLVKCLRKMFQLRDPSSTVPSTHSDPNETSL